MKYQASQNSKFLNQDTVAISSLIILTLVFCVGWILFYILTMPQGWLGGMDGYFYASMIKTYTYQFNLAAIDPASPMNYPQYFFYLIGMIGRLFQIDAMDTLSWIAHLISYLAYPLISFFLLRILFGNYRSIIIVMLSYAFFYFAWGFEHLWEKPHEIISLCANFSALVYLSHIKNQNISRNNRIFAGIVFGFTIGSYTPFVIVSFFSVCLVIVFDCLFKLFRKTPISFMLKYFDISFCASALAVAFPYILTIILTNVEYDHGMGHVPAAFVHNLKFEFLLAGKDSIVNFAAIAFSIFVVIKLFIKKRIRPPSAVFSTTCHLRRLAFCNYCLGLPIWPKAYVPF